MDICLEVKTLPEFFKQYEIDRLKKLNIDINSDNYMQSPNWESLERSYVSHGFFEQESWWIEKNLVGQERLERIYGPYMLGITRSLSEEELEERTWFDNLTSIYFDPDAESSTITPETIHKYFYRNEKANGNSSERLGLIERLKRAGLDIDKFNEKQARIKLLYFLFRFERDYKVRLSAFLTN